MNLLKGSRRGVVVFFIMIFSTTSCSTTKEMRRANRATRKLEKLTMRFPELLKPDTNHIPITLKTPVIKGNLSGKLDLITLPSHKEFPQKIQLRDQANSIDQVQSMQGIFEDDTLKAKVILYKDGSIIIDYEIKPIAVDSTIQVIDTKIQPVQYKPMPLKWWQITLMVFGGAFLLTLFYKITF